MPTTPGAWTRWVCLIYPNFSMLWLNNAPGLRLSLPAWTPHNLQRTGTHPVLGEMSVSGIFRIIAIHEQMHTREIAAIRAQIG